MAPSGLITYISKAFGGRASDKQIVLKTKILDMIQPNEAVMVDKGFLLEKECLQRKIQFIQPPFFSSKKKQFSRSEATDTASIAAARVHVERAIQRLKLFKILKGPIPHHLIPHIDSIMITIAAIVNLSSPIIADDKF